jgi:hypothetical protein
MIHKGKGKVLSFGELLLRICPDSESSWLKKNELPFYIGGAELNVATALALWELPSKYCTVLPKNLVVGFNLVTCNSKFLIAIPLNFISCKKLNKLLDLEVWHRLYFQYPLGLAPFLFVILLQIQQHIYCSIGESFPVSFGIDT